MSGTKHDDGGPAFPRSDDTVDEEGMSLRDWFAGMALNGLLQNTHVQGAFSEGLNRNANAAYEIADAMLKERVKAEEDTDAPG